MNATGRPRGFESRRRTQEFLRLVAEGSGLLEAARAAGMSPERALRLLDEPAVLAVVLASRDGMWEVAA